MASLGSYLCVKFDFLMFTHEFVVIMKKVDTSTNDLFKLEPLSSESVPITFVSSRKFFPDVKDRKALALGTIWNFNNPDTGFNNLIMSRIIERYGKNDCVWEQINIKAFLDEVESFTKFNKLLMKIDCWQINSRWAVY